MTDSDKDNITNEETANVEDAATDVAVETSEDQSTETSNDAESEESSQEAVIEDDSPVSSISLEEKSPSEIVQQFESKQLKTDIPSFRPKRRYICLKLLGFKLLNDFRWRFFF